MYVCMYVRTYVRTYIRLYIYVYISSLLLVNLVKHALVDVAYKPCIMAACSYSYAKFACDID